MREPTFWLREMLDHAEEVLALVASRRREDLDADRALELQTTHLLLLLGEAAAHVPDAQREAVDLPWRAIVGMRNNIVHGYFELDHDLVWQALEDGVPMVRDALRRHLE